MPGFIIKKSKEMKSITFGKVWIEDFCSKLMASELQAMATEDASLQEQRVELRDAQRVIIVYKDSTLGQHHAYL